MDRESRIISDAYPYIASRLLTDSAPELQSALQQLLFKDGKPRSATVDCLSVQRLARAPFLYVLAGTGIAKAVFRFYITWHVNVGHPANIGSSGNREPFHAWCSTI